MKKWILLLSTVFLFQCQSKKANSGMSEAQNLLGKWEATYTIRDQDTTFFNKDSMNSCAYTVLAYEYSSGFELMSGQTGNIIWCANLKDDLFNWSLQSSTLFITATSGNKDSLQIKSLGAHSMDILNSKGTFYHLEKY